nr:hypothetical protein [Tanacetum cinerariifolium]
MSSITTQQAKLDLELFPKEKRLEIGKCNERLNPRKIQRVNISSHSKWTEGRDTNSPWKSSRSALEEIKSLNDVVVDLCINLGEVFLLLLTKVYPKRQLVLTSFVSLKHKSFGKSSKAQKGGVVIRETLEMPFSKKREKEVQKKSMRDFHKTHLSGSGSVTKTDPSAAKIKPFVTNKGTSVKLGVPNVTEEESSKNNENESDFESDQEENKEEIGDDEEKEEDEFVRTLSNDSDEDETKITDKAEGDENEEMDYTTGQLYDDVDIRLNEPVDTDKGFLQEEGTDAAMTNVQQGDENLKILQVIEDAHVTLSTVPQKTEVLVTSSSCSSDLAAKFLNFLVIPHTDAEISSPMDVYVHHEVPSQQTPTLLTVPVSFIFDSSPVFSTVIPQSLPSFTYPPQ